LASRVESLTKFYGVDIMVTESTEKNQSRFVFRKLDQVRVKGKQNAISLYELVCLETQITSELKEELALHHQALVFYFSQKWDEAEMLMQKLHSTYPHAKIYSIYLERIAEFKHHPLPDNWDGVYVHETK
jgi:adenylate cyclase